MKRNLLSKPFGGKRNLSGEPFAASPHR